MEAIIDNSFEKDKLNENIKKIKKRIKNLKMKGFFVGQVFIKFLIASYSQIIVALKSLSESK